MSGSNGNELIEQLLPVKFFTESILLVMVYNNRKTIWDNLIICGIRNGKVAIDDNQLDRICMPNLNIGNSNLLHEWSRISQTKL